MITREHRTLDGVNSMAIYSDCEKYRYFLSRMWWYANGKKLVFIMLNPSTATEEKNDPTIERCQRRAIAGKYDGVVILNLFAFRATDPHDMKASFDPIGPDNDDFLRRAIGGGDVICGWGTHGGWLNREQEVLAMFRDLGVTPMALAWTKGGHPQHPLYLPYSAVPIERP